MARSPIPVKLVCRTVNAVLSTVDIPVARLREYFRAWGINLQLAQGPPLYFDPTQDPQHVSALLDDTSPAAGVALPWPATLVVGTMAADGWETNGMLLDVTRRGAAVVYALSSTFANGDADTKFEIFVHEIGHLLNLTHDDADDDYPTAMDQWASRAGAHGSRENVWASAISAIPGTERARLQSFFDQGRRRPIGLPMSSKAAQFMWGHQPVHDIQPWGSGFRDSGDYGIDDARREGLHLDVTLDRERHWIADPLSFTVVLQLSRKAPAIVVPAMIGLKYGSLQLRIRSPDGQSHVCGARSAACADGTIRLRPGGRMVRNYSFISDRSRLIFPKAGEYRIDVAIPSLAIEARPIFVNVKHPGNPVLENQSFQKFLSDGMPVSRRAHWRTVDMLLKDGISGGLRCFLSEAHISKFPKSRKNPVLLRLLERRGGVPTRIGERAALLQVCRAHAAGNAVNSPLNKQLARTRRRLASNDPEHSSLKFLDYIETGQF